MLFLSFCFYDILSALRIDAETSDIKDYLDKSKELQKLSGEVPEHPSEITPTEITATAAEVGLIAAR